MVSDFVKDERYTLYLRIESKKLNIIWGVCASERVNIHSISHHKKNPQNFIQLGKKAILVPKLRFRFCKRHADYLNPDLSLDVRLPDHLEDRANRFKLVLQQLVREKSFGPGEIGTMDELPLHLTPSLRLTLAQGILILTKRFCYFWYL